MNTDERLGTESVWKLFLHLTIPCVLAQLINLLYTIIDRIYIGYIPNIGGDALAGIGVTTSVTILISAFSQFVGGGGAPLAAQSLGRKDYKNAEKILGNGFVLLILFSIFLPVLFFCIMKPFLYTVGASDTTYIYARDYLSIYLLGTFFVQVTIGLNPFITAQNKSLVAMLSILIGALCNIALDPLFIYGFHMGIKGAAIATVISQCFSAIWILCFLFSKKSILRIKKENMKLCKKTIFDIFSLGISPFIMCATEAFISLVLNHNLKKYGGDTYVSSLTILSSVMMLITVPLSGFQTGVTPIISYNFGARNIKRVKEIQRKAFYIFFGFCTGFASIIMLFPGFFCRLFTEKQSILEISIKALPYFVAGMLVFGIQRSCQTNFIAMGEAKISLFIALLRKVILLIPLAYILPNYFDVFGVFYAEPIADTIAATLCGIIFIFRSKKIFVSIENEKIKTA